MIVNLLCVIFLLMNVMAMVVSEPSSTSSIQRGWQTNVHRSGKDQSGIVVETLYGDSKIINKFDTLICSNTSTSTIQWPISFIPSSPLSPIIMLIDNCNEATAASNGSLTLVGIDRTRRGAIVPGLRFEWNDYSSPCYDYQTLCSYAWLYDDDHILVSAKYKRSQPVMLLLDVSPLAIKTGNARIPVCQLDLPFTALDILATDIPITPTHHNNDDNDDDGNSNEGHRIGILVDQEYRRVIAMDLSLCRMMWTFEAAAARVGMSGMTRAALSFNQKTVYVQEASNDTTRLIAIDIRNGHMIWMDHINHALPNLPSSPIVIPLPSLPDNSQSAITASSYGMVCYQTHLNVRCLNGWNGTQIWTYTYKHYHLQLFWIEERAVVAYHPMMKQLYITEGGSSAMAIMALSAIDGSLIKYWNPVLTNSDRWLADYIPLSIIIDGVSGRSMAVVTTTKVYIMNTTRGYDNTSQPIQELNGLDSRVTSIIVDRWLYLYDRKWGRNVVWSPINECNKLAIPCSNHGLCEVKGGCTCSEGYQGDSCAVCQPGYRFDNGTCDVCDGNTLVVSALFIAIVGLLVFLAIKLNQLRFVREVSIPLRTGAVYFQTIALLLGNHLSLFIRILRLLVHAPLIARPC
jgi:hypothetical protein